ncbi:MAG TPA: hypothetical protein VER12_06840 [Polyangiaceae bacterium]|nr:hypothetical protein [Polyangiaceae bacterium]HYQ30388.1 hypothetical protein [Polyangiaceae bacterium]
MFKRHPFSASAIAVVCIACSARFTANDGTGPSGVAGEASGGSATSAGTDGSGDAGETEAAGSPGSAGERSSAGAGGTTAGAGGSNAGRGGWGNGGRWSGSGGASATDCATLRQDYQAAVEKARVCDKGSTDQCSPSSSAQPIGGCGCPVLINAKSESATAVKKTYQAYQDAKCDFNGPVCDIFCEPPTAASCAQQTVGSGFVCTGSQK